MIQEVDSLKSILASKEKELLKYESMSKVLIANKSFVDDVDLSVYHEQELQSLNILKQRNDERREAEHKLADLQADKNALELKVSYLSHELEVNFSCGVLGCDQTDLVILTGKGSSIGRVPS